MRAMPFAFILIFASAAYFVLRASTAIGDVPPLAVTAAFVGVAGAAILIVNIYAIIARRLNQTPEPPYYIIDAAHGRCLELAEDGSYEGCQTLLKYLSATFGAQYSNHLDPGPSPGSDKDKGYWNLIILGQDFFLMRQRGYGICIWGPKPPADISGFLKLVEHFHATEFKTWPRRLFRSPAHRFCVTGSAEAK